MEEVLTQIWPKSVKKYVSELFNKEMNTQKENLKNTSGIHASTCKPTKKCAMKMKQRRNDARVKMFLMEGSPL